MAVSYAPKGSQRWLQVAVDRAPSLLDAALRTAGAIALDETVTWRSPVSERGFAEYRDQPALDLLDIDVLPNRSLHEFWPKRGPVWDGLGISSGGRRLLVEAKAHIAEAASPGSKASEVSLAHIRRSLEEARRFYAPQASASWSGNLYQYANRLAFHYFLNVVNGISSGLIFLDFCNAEDVNGPESEEKWKGATELIHALLGLPRDLTSRGVFHVYLDVREVRRAL
jgi:hypothetical protein